MNQIFTLSKSCMFHHASGTLLCIHHSMLQGHASPLQLYAELLLGNSLLYTAGYCCCSTGQVQHHIYFALLWTQPIQSILGFT